MNAKIIISVIISSLCFNSCLNYSKSNKTAETKKQINTSDKETSNENYSALFYGSWVEPNPINNKEVQGFTLKTNGQAESINMHTLLYKKWWVQGNKFYLVSESIRNKTSSIDTAEYEVQKISDKELILKYKELLLHYKKHP